MSSSPLMRSAAATVVVLCLGSFAAQPALAWRATSIPVWSAPYPGAAWTFALHLTNTGNTSMQISDFTVWTNWGDPPTTAEPQHTSTALPVAVDGGGTFDFGFTISVPGSAAGGHYHLAGEIVAANPNGTGGWQAPQSGSFFGWNFTVLSSPPVPGAPFSMFSLIIIGLIATSITLRLIFYRRRSKASPPSYGPPPAPGMYPPPPPQGPNPPPGGQP